MSENDGFYNPGAFRLQDDDHIGRIIDATVFGTLVSNGPDGPRASHVPFLLDRQTGNRGALVAHLARGNEHWRHLDGEPALVIFQGPEHYVTPSWYASKAGTGKVVPTWNYVVVHVRGHVSVHRDRDRLHALVTSLTTHLEARRPAPWQVSDAPVDYVDRMVEQIVGLDLAIEHAEGKLKLGQNRAQEDRESLARGLERERPDVWSALDLFREPMASDPGGT